MRTVALLLALAPAAAFVPMQPRVHAVRAAPREFGFLKDLGLEKPDWLPDFGGKKEEPAAAAEPAEEAAEEEAVAAAEE